MEDQEPFDHGGCPPPSVVVVVAVVVVFVRGVGHANQRFLQCRCCCLRRRSRRGSVNCMIDSSSHRVGRHNTAPDLKMGRLRIKIRRCMLLMWRCEEGGERADRCCNLVWYVCVVFAVCCLLATST